MPRTNAVVDEVEDVARQEEVRAVVSTRPAGQYRTVSFAGGRSGLLDMTEHRSRVWAEVLQSLREARTPAYVEIDPQTQLITEVLQPIRFTVGEISPVKDGVEVEFIVSHARHYLRRSNPDFEELLGALDEARKAPRPVWVTETLDEHEVIDVRPAPGEAVRMPGSRRRG